MRDDYHGRKDPDLEFCGHLTNVTCTAEDDDADFQSHEGVFSREQLLLHGSLVNGVRSVKALCGSPNSHGRNWYFYKEHHCCHMATRTLAAWLLC